MENFEILKEAADGMLGKLLKVTPGQTHFDFNVDMDGKGYKVYYERKTINDHQVWVFTSWEQVGG
jgi:hypothetical protein